MKKLLYLLLTVLIVGCSSDDSNETSSQQFRSIYNNTFWCVDTYCISFAPNKLFYEERYNSETGELFCGFYEEGTFNNVDLNDCIFGTIYYFVVEEDSDTLTMRSIQSDGVPEEGAPTTCDGGVSTLSFQIIDENLMEITITFTQAGIEESETLYALRSDNSFSTNDCVNQPLNGNTFW